MHLGKYQLILAPWISYCSISLALIINLFRAKYMHEAVVRMLRLCVIATLVECLLVGGARILWLIVIMCIVEIVKDFVSALKFLKFTRSSNATLLDYNDFIAGFNGT